MQENYLSSIILENIGYSLNKLGKNQAQKYVKYIESGMHPVQAYEKARPSVLEKKKKTVRKTTIEDIIHDPSLINLDELENKSREEIRDILKIKIAK